MVRLKDLALCDALGRGYNFNSTMVRLKVDSNTYGPTSTKFQFHYGTIKSPYLLVDKFSGGSFQFHYGTIKRFFLLALLVLITYFNSTMVRLKVDLSRRTCFTAKVFQFHYGTIKSVNGRVCGIRRTISIPLWYD